jgi:hypothetical protein
MRRQLPHTTVVVLFAAVLVAASAATLAVTGVGSWTILLAFGGAIAIGELLRLTLPGDRDTAPLASAAALGLSLVSSVHGNRTGFAVAEVIVTAAAAGLLGSAIHAFAGRAPRLDGVARRVLAAAVTAAVARPLLTGEIFPGHHFHGAVEAGLFGIAAVLGGCTDIATTASIRAERQHVPYRAAIRDDAAALWRLDLAILATGMLLAYGASLMGVLALLFFGLPLAVTQFAFRRYAVVRTTFRQTMRSMARVTEIGGYVHEGHSSRVAQLATSIGAQHGFGDADLLDLEYAALLHDIGQLSLTEAIPGGSTLVVTNDERRRVADLGADIVRSTGRLDRVAAIVAGQAAPYRAPGQASDPDVPFASRIVKAASAYDDLVHGAAGRRLTPAEALERLRQGMAYEYDPAVIGLLERVVARRAAERGLTRV